MTDYERLWNLISEELNQLNLELTMRFLVGETTYQLVGFEGAVLAEAHSGSPLDFLEDVAVELVEADWTYIHPDRATTTDHEVSDELKEFVEEEIHE